MRILLVILAALIVAGGTGFYVLQGLQPPVAKAAVTVKAPELREVYVPSRELAAGTIITPEHLSRMKLQEQAITEQMVVADAAGTAFLAGSVARQVLPLGVPVARSAIVQPGDRGFLAAVLPKGKRAITIAISEVAGLGGLVLPGDRVDLILTYSIQGDVIDAEREIRASETVMKNIRVLALDQRLGAAQSVDKNGKAEVPPVARTATLEVTPQQAEMITLGQTLGDLSLILNSVRDGGDPAEILGSGLAEAVSSFGSSADSASPRHMTLDSDVTSLLRRQLAAQENAVQQAAAVASVSPVPLPDRTARVQIVRGVQSQDVQIGLEPGAAATPAAAEPVAD